MWVIKRIDAELYLLVGNKPVWVPITEATVFPALAEAERAQMTPMIWADSLVVEAPEKVPEAPLPKVKKQKLPKLRDIPPRQLRGVQVLERGGTLFYAVEEGFCVICMPGQAAMVAEVAGLETQRSIETFVSAMSRIHYQAQGGMRATVELRDLEVI